MHAVSRRAAYAVIAIGLIGMAAALAVTLSQRRIHLAGTNSIRPAIYLVNLPAHGMLCQSSELVPSDTGALRVFVGGYGKRVGPLRVTVMAHGRRLTGGSVAAGFKDGDLAVAVRRVRTTAPATTVCLHNDGLRQVALAGRAGEEPAARLASHRIAGRIEIEYLQPRPRSWWSLVGTIARRVGVARAAAIGGWSLWIAAALLGLGWVITLRQLLAEARRCSR